MRRPARLVAGFRDNGENRLPVEIHLAVHQDRIIMLAGRADVIVPGNVISGQNANDARRTGDL